MNNNNLIKKRGKREVPPSKKDNSLTDSESKKLRFIEGYIQPASIFTNLNEVFNCNK